MRQNLRFFLIARAKWNTFCPAALFPLRDKKQLCDEMLGSAFFSDMKYRILN
jgi:hypothetical protein